MNHISCVDLRPVDQLSPQEMRDEITFLRSEMGLSAEKAAVARLIDLGLLRGEARMLLALGNAPKRLFTTLQLLDIGLMDGRRDATTAIVHVYICRIRKRLGNDAVRTFYGEGYQITKTGMIALAGILASP